MQRRSLLVVVFLFAAIATASLLLGRRERMVASAHPSTSASAPVELEPTAGLGDTVPMAGAPPQVEEFVRNGQWWRAARAMRTLLAGRPDAGPETVLLGARAEAGWGGWARVREYLEDADWLDRVQGGEGWYWLARALEEDDRPEEALVAYTRFLRGEAAGEAGSDRRLAAELRRGLLLVRLGRAEEGAALMEGLREGAPSLAPWLDVLSAEGLAARGDSARVRSLAEAIELPELRMRARRAVLDAYREAGDQAGLLAVARRYRAEAGSASERAEMGLAAGRAALALGDTAAAREQLRTVLAEAPGSGSARAAAGLLDDLGRLSAADRLQVARVLDRHGAHPPAIAHYRAWLEAGEGSAEQRREVRLALGTALFDAGRYPDAVAALQPLADAPGATGASALHLIGRAEYRRGNRQTATRTWQRLAERHPGSTAGSEGLFLMADLSHDAGEVEQAARGYRRVASDFAGTDRSGLSLMRLAGIAYQQRRFAEAAELWEEYRTRYPQGERWLQSTYWAGRAYEAAGQRDRAAERYAQVRQREPMSYYALVAAERLGEQFWPVPTSPSPPENPAARARVEGWMRGVDLLREAGLHEEAEAEADRWIARAGNDPALLYPLAETLNERGLTVRGIRIGLRLQREVERPSDRLLRILYPFPYRAMVAAEAREKGLDPFLVAALTRQESLFKARISSPVGARGLMQIMPQTGAPLARAAGIDGWDPELLYQPEINVHLGTRYLADQMRSYDESLPAVFSAYNAGPHRINRWMEIFPEWGDEQLFTERIPYRETRDYVKILTRNIALYRGLYGEAGSGGGTADGP